MGNLPTPAQLRRLHFGLSNSLHIFPSGRRRLGHDTETSGEVDLDGQRTKRGDAMVRRFLFEAAKMA